MPLFPLPYSMYKKAAKLRVKIYVAVKKTRPKHKQCQNICTAVKCNGVQHLCIYRPIGPGIHNRPQWACNACPPSNISRPDSKSLLVNIPLCVQYSRVTYAVFTAYLVFSSVFQKEVKNVFKRLCRSVPDYADTQF